MRCNYADEDTCEIHDTNSCEIGAFLGLLIYTSVFNSNHENISTLFATDRTGRDILRAVMNQKRFAILLANLCFYNPDDRKDNPLAPI